MSFDFDDELLNFANTFLGYGKFNSKYWFIGMEEGGGSTKEEIERRLKAWIKFERPELCDVAKFHNEIGELKLFSEKPALQKTWDKLIRFQLTAEGNSSDKEDARIFQRDSLGRLDSNNTLMELLPLPSPKASTWNYSDYSTLTVLKDRKTYQSFFLDRRILNIKEKIEHYQPKCVFFYGFKKYWKDLTENLRVDLTYNEELDCYLSTINKTQLLFADHPTRTGLPSGYYEKLGAYIREKI